MDERTTCAQRILEKLLTYQEWRAALLDSIKRDFVPSTHDLITNAELIATYRTLVNDQIIKENKTLEAFLAVKSVRSRSGVAIVTLLTMPHPCPGQCIYCPDEVKMPKSYISTEPAAARALTLRFDPYLQTSRRIRALISNGHAADKIELIIKGGTWSSYPRDYQEWFIQQSFLAMNEITGPERVFEYHPGSPYSRFVGEEKKSWNVSALLQAQQINETSTHRCIGLTIETRPDHVSPEEIAHLRLLGCTRVELGLQTTDDEIHRITQRGHDSTTVADATLLLKDAGFKVDYHIMPGLPTATPEGDVASAREVFTTDRFQPDTIKLYPCVVTPNTVLHTWWQEGRYTPYTSAQIVQTLAEIKALVPPYVRIARVIRDFPSPEIAAGNMTTNLREHILTYMEERGLKCVCIRCREVGHQKTSHADRAYLPASTPATPPTLHVQKYPASGGIEYFISMKDVEDTLYGFIRLRIPSPQSSAPKTLPELTGCALVRELHVYGTLVPLRDRDDTAAQHKGYGRILLTHAEALAREHGFGKIAVISGVGVREYYKKSGYTLEGTYMVKSLD